MSLDEHRRLAAALGDAIVQRGVLQHFFVGPLLPMEPLSPRALGDAWQRLARDSGAAEVLHLYLHIPFCAHRCRYCVYYSIGESEPALREAYLERLSDEIDFYARRVTDLSFTTCYLGGGTPTVLDEAQLRQTLDHLDSAFRRKRGGEWAFECNPLTLTEAKAGIFRDHGFNRVSFGVQTLSPQVLRGVNRGYQSRHSIAEAFRVLKSLKLRINVDLIFGLPGEAPASMIHSLEQICQLDPTQVTIYAINPYTPMPLDASRREPIAVWLERVKPVAEREGYEISALSTCIALTRRYERDDNLLNQEHNRESCTTKYDDTTVEPCSLLGIGPTARSYVYGQLRAMGDPYPVDAPFDAEAPCATGRAITLAEERRRYAVYQLERPGGLGRKGYREIFGEPPEQRFGEALAELVSAGLLKEEAEAYTLAEADLLERFAAELCFVEPAMIEAAWRQIKSERPAPGSSEAAQGSKIVAVAVAVGDLRLRVMLTRHQPDLGCYDSLDGFAFFLPSDQPEGEAVLRPRQERLAEVFDKLFKQVIRRTKPAGIGQLRDGLIAAARQRRGIAVTEVILR